MQALMIGTSGSGKGYEAVRYQILPALESGRLVVTNMPLVLEEWGKLNPNFPGLIELRKGPLPIRGRWNPEREEGAFDLFEDGGHQARTGERRFSSAWDFYHEWRHPETGQGPLYIVDEAQLSVPRDGKLDKTLFEWQTLHRHFGADVFWMTQDHKSLHRGFLGNIQISYWMHKKTAWGEPDKYIKKVRDKIRGAAMNEAERSYDSAYFKLWRSHTQGIAVREFSGADIKPWNQHWTKRGARLFFAVGGLMLIWAGWRALFHEKPTPVTAATRKAVSVVAQAPAPQQAPLQAQPPVEPKPQEQPAEAPAPDPAPFDGLGVHILGTIQRGPVRAYLVALSQQAQQLRTMPSMELEAAGYVVTPVSDCAARLAWRGVEHWIRCDSPAQSVRVGGGPATKEPGIAGRDGGDPQSGGVPSRPSELGPAGTIGPGKHSVVS